MGLIRQVCNYRFNGFEQGEPLKRFQNSEQPLITRLKPCVNEMPLLRDGM